MIMPPVTFMDDLTTLVNIADWNNYDNLQLINQCHFLIQKEQNIEMWISF